MKGRYLVVIAVVGFLIFVGANIACPSHPYVRCVATDSSGNVLSSTSVKIRPNREQATKQFTARAEKNGEKCSVITVRECLWDSYF